MTVNISYLGHSKAKIDAMREMADICSAVRSRSTFGTAIPSSRASIMLNIRSFNLEVIMRIYSGSLQIDTGKLKDTEQIFIHNTTLENWKVEAVIELFVFITKVQVF